MLDTDALWVILTGMLGIAGLRSLDKKTGKATAQVRPIAGAASGP
jgi:hypothetical protein